MADKPLLLTKSQAAEMLGVSTSTFSNWVASGHMPDALPGVGRWSRVQLERAASGLPWVPSEGPVSPPPETVDHWESHEQSRKLSLPHSTSNSDFDDGRPLGKREVALLKALAASAGQLNEGDVAGVSVATIEKLGLRGYLVPNDYFFELKLTPAGRTAASKL